VDANTEKRYGLAVLVLGAGILAVFLLGFPAPLLRAWSPDTEFGWLQVFLGVALPIILITVGTGLMLGVLRLRVRLI